LCCPGNSLPVASPDAFCLYADAISNTLYLPYFLHCLQASRAELLAELARLHAVQLGGRWRLVDEAYLGSLLEMLIMTYAAAAAAAVAAVGDLLLNIVLS
jgi:hypothetical protein